MQYRPFGKLGFDVSTLGFGCMRLPLKERNANAHGNVIEEHIIDEPRAIGLIRSAIDAGVNYVDTAYNYHVERSELIVAKALEGGYRERVKLATKLPFWLVKETADFDRLLNTQLEKLQTDYIDFYLLHAMNGSNWPHLKGLGVLDFLDRAMSDGRVRYPSFSFHDRYPVFEEILTSYDWAMCQIQLNYMDIEHQAGLKGLQLAGSRNVPVAIMEPLLGGKLAQKPPADIQAIWDRSGVERSPAEWALRWVANFPEVAVILSGMNTEQQLAENIRTLSEAKPDSLSASELPLYDEVRQLFRNRNKVDCTQCRYCMPCPQKVNIPGIFGLYNQQSIYGTADGAFLTYASMKSQGMDASRCVECSVCEEKCPQQLAIVEQLKQAHLVLAD